MGVWEGERNRQYDYVKHSVRETDVPSIVPCQKFMRNNQRPKEDISSEAKKFIFSLFIWNSDLIFIA